jgi:hypothetical protein
MKESKQTMVTVINQFVCLDAELNTILKARFKELHVDVIKLNLSPVIHYLFAKNVISEADLSELIKSEGKTSERLMALLHHNYSDHPEAFVQLRLAIREEPAYSWFIDRLDDDTTKIAIRLSQLKLGNYSRHDSFFSFVFYGIQHLLPSILTTLT